MSSNNATIAHPGANWEFLWPNSFGDFQLDIVGFLAILGEGSIQSVAQVSALSRLFLLPRLLPAPQALLRTTRPNKLESTDAAVSAINSGNFKDHLHHVANVLLGDEMEPYEVRCLVVTRTTTDNSLNRTLSDRFFRGVPSTKASDSSGHEPPTVKAKFNGPLLYVTLLDFLCALCLLIISLVLGDPMSFIATLLLSILSTLVGWGNKWTLELQKITEEKAKERAEQQANTESESSDDPEKNGGSRVSQLAKQKEEEEDLRETRDNGVVVRYPNGSYMVVRCNEKVARELYFAPEKIQYTLKSATWYRLISLIGTLLLMLGVICLANAKLELQLAWGGAYLLLNAVHWLAAAAPARWHWDLQCYKVREEYITEGPKCKNFTEALWKAIVFAKGSKWAKIGKTPAPSTPVWEKWLDIADQEAKKASVTERPLEKPLRHYTTDRSMRWPLERYPKAEDKCNYWTIPSWNAKGAWDDLNNAEKAEREANSSSATAAQA